MRHHRPPTRPALVLAPGPSPTRFVDEPPDKLPGPVGFAPPVKREPILWDGDQA